MGRSWQACRVLPLALLLLAALPRLARGQVCGGTSAWTLPPGFSLQAYADGTIKNARSLAVSGNSKLTGPVITYVSALDFSGGQRGITALVDESGRGAADYAQVIASPALLDASMPNGIAWYAGDLYLAVLKPDTWFRLYRIKGVDAFALGKKEAAQSDLELLRDDLPIDFWHGWKFIRFDASGNLYIPIGANMNIGFINGTTPTSSVQWPALNAAGGTGVSNPYRKGDGYPTYKFASIYRFAPPYTGGLPGQTGAPPEQIARGVRNTVGFAWHPQYGLYFTDNGRDDIGGANLTFTNNAPDCEINYWGKTTSAPITSPKYFGYPFCHTGPNGALNFNPYVRPAGIGPQIPDPNTNPGEGNMRCNQAPLPFVPAIQAAGPHMAPLGMRFFKWFRKANFPRSWDGAAFIAAHGSWNRYVPDGAIGAKVMSLKLSGPTQVASYDSFMSGGIPGDKGAPTGPDPKPAPTAAYIGRPVDVDFLPDGSMLVSDDAGGRVFRVNYCSAPWYGRAANYGVGRCGGVQRGSGGGAGAVGLKLPKDVTPCWVRAAGNASSLYQSCARVDLTGRGTWATIAWTFVSKPGDASAVRLRSAVVWDDFAGVVGTGWVAYGLAAAGGGEVRMRNANVLMSRASSGPTGASVIDFQLGGYDPSAFSPTPAGTFYNKTFTLKAGVAGGALVQEAEFVVSLATLAGWGNGARVLMAMGDTSASTGSFQRHWYTPWLTLPFSSADVDPTIPPSTTRIANPRVVGADVAATATAPYPEAGPNCTVEGVTYDHCYALNAGTDGTPVPVTHYYSSSGGVITAAIRATIGALTPDGWVAWQYNAGAPGTMTGSDSNAVFARGGPDVTPSAALARMLTSYTPSLWSASTFFTSPAASALPGGDILLTFSFAYPSGASSIMIMHAAGTYNPSSPGAGPANMLGMNAHVAARPAKLCLRSTGVLAPVSQCGFCD